MCWKAAYFRVSLAHISPCLASPDPEGRVDGTARFLMHSAVSIVLFMAAVVHSHNLRAS